MKMRAQDGHLFAEVTLRDVLERTDVSDMPMLSEVKRLYDENDKLRELVRHLYEYRQSYFKTGIYPTDHGVTERRMRELGIEVDG